MTSYAMPLKSMTCLNDHKPYSAHMSENPYIERRRRARNRSFITLRVIIMGILVMATVWAGFWFWLGADTDAAAYLTDWLVSVLLIILLLMTAAFTVVALRKILSLFSRKDDSFAALATSEDAAGEQEEPREG